MSQRRAHRILQWEGSGKDLVIGNRLGNRVGTRGIWKVLRDA